MSERYCPKCNSPWTHTVGVNFGEYIEGFDCGSAACKGEMRREGMDCLRNQLAALQAKYDELKERISDTCPKCGEKENLRGELASACDLVNTWARETGTRECENPYTGLALRQAIDDLWTRQACHRPTGIMGDLLSVDFTHPDCNEIQMVLHVRVQSGGVTCGPVFISWRQQ